jgi:outer membrane protein OmpA-like peptidoglycan-associated protein
MKGMRSRHRQRSARAQAQTFIFSKEITIMLKSIIAVAGVALLLGACSSTPPQMASAPPPAAVQAPSYMVFFDWDRSDLSAQAMSTIRQAAIAYKSGASARVTAVGHTDTSGPADYNMALSLRRATAVKGALVQEGVPATAIDTVGRGEQGLLVQTADGVREPQNRRVEIVGPQAQMSRMDVFKDPRAYCKALSDKYREYRTAQEQTPQAAAMYQCEQGDYQAGIPVLEDALISYKIPLPAPGYRWPGKSYSPS